METSTLGGIHGLGGLYVVRSPEYLQVKGLWYLLETDRLAELFASYEANRIVTYVGPVTVKRLDGGIRQPVPVRIRSLETSVDEATGEVQVTASLYGLTAHDFVLQAGIPRMRDSGTDWSFV